MKSFESRSKSFMRWKISPTRSKSLHLAITGFYSISAQESEGTACIYCSKSLVGWEINDIPSLEHYNHNKNCIIFNVDDGIARRKTFDYCFNSINTSDCTVLARNGFFAYSFIEGYDEFLCYKCGYALNNSTEIEKAVHHFNTCDQKKIKEEKVRSKKKSFRKSFDFQEQNKYNYENVNNLFYIDLLNGKYNEQVVDYIENSDMSVIIDMDDDLKSYLKNIEETNCLMTLKEHFERGFKKNMEELENVMNKNIGDSIDELNRKPN